jgi:hypothetical protein
MMGSYPTTKHFSAHFMDLMNLYDNERALTHDCRIRMYEDLLVAVTSDDMISDLILNDVLKSLRLYCEELTSSNNYHIIYKFEAIFSRWMHIPPKTIYHNPQNVHVFMTPAAQAAKEIMSKYPCTYTHKPFEHPFFDVIETEELVNGIDIRNLFASVWLYITTHKEHDALTRRLIEEMNESEDMCLSGHMVRLVNTVKGFDDAFEFNLEQYEYNKAHIFNQLNKLLDVTVLDNLLDQMENVINGALDVSGVCDDEVLKILRDYSKTEWIYDTQFRYVR